MFFFILLGVSVFCSAVNIFAARYYRLLEKERKIFLGLKGLDSLAALEYLNLDSPAERAEYYKNFWSGKPETDRQEFEERIEYAYNKFGRHAPLSDDRIPVYVKYGPPSIREEITPQKKIAFKVKEVVKPAEIWTYNNYGKMFDFVRFVRAYELIAVSTFGESLKVPYLEEIKSDTITAAQAEGILNFDVASGKYRQRKNLTRLEIYISVMIEDTAGVLFSREIKIFNAKDSLIQSRSDLLKPKGGRSENFFDEVDFWLTPDEYHLEITLHDLKNQKSGTKTKTVNLLDYQNDAKEISDLIFARVIDDAFTHKKFEKPVGRVIPLAKSIFPVYLPFYLYAEIYNLKTEKGEYHIKTIYEVYNKQKMRREIVDIMIEDHIGLSSTAYLAAKYHPMDLKPGYYMIVLRVKDMIGGKECTAVNEFKLTEPEKNEER